jgi:hypothetical protein
MRKQHQYGERDDGTYAFSVSFSDVHTDTISALFFDDTDMEATPDTWLTQTVSLIEKMKQKLGDLGGYVISIEPTNDPMYALAFVVNTDKAVAIQSRIEIYILSMLSRLYIAPS